MKGRPGEGAAFTAAHSGARRSAALRQQQRRRDGAKTVQQPTQPRTHSIHSHVVAKLLD